MSLKDIDKNIRAITTSAHKLNLLIHETAMMVANHAQEHGDCTRALTLVKAMPASMRRTMLVLWFQRFTPIRVVEKNDKVGILKPEAKDYSPFDLEAGDLTPFFELAEQNPEQGMMDFAAMVKMVESLGKRIEKKIEEGKVKPEDLQSARAISQRLTSLKFNRVEAEPANNDVEPALKAVG